ncbi:trypsin delta-like [Lycorma delicatula]|uniref:trypsin delta-like n=1 Tax=Lycorma delicatula TaxID=130591 RepID=UPI003F519DDA
MAFFQFFSLICFVSVSLATEIHPFDSITGVKEDLPIVDDEFIPKIAGGTNTTINKHRYIGSLHHNGTFVGSVVILNNKWAVTAAWNLFWAPASSFIVRFGSSYANKEGNTVGIKKYYIYPHYAQEWIYDIALLKFSQVIPYSGTVRGIKLASKLPISHTETIVSGWGWDKHIEAGTNILQEATVNYVNFKKCKPRYSDVSGFTKYSFCTSTQGAGPCARDFGSPLVYNNKLIGVFSGTCDCGGTVHPAVYADITKYRQWIEQTIKKHSDFE